MAVRLIRQFSWGITNGLKGSPLFSFNRLGATSLSGARWGAVGQARAECLPQRNVSIPGG